MSANFVATLTFAESAIQGLLSWQRIVSTLLVQLEISPSHRNYSYRNEREGIPVPIIHLLDSCVEIPQFGMVRSLNAHVSGALLVWEYVKQHLVKMDTKTSLSFSTGQLTSNSTVL